MALHEAQNPYERKIRNQYGLETLTSSQYVRSLGGRTLRHTKNIENPLKNNKRYKQDGYQTA